MNSCIAYNGMDRRVFIETIQTEWDGKWNEKIMYYGRTSTCKSLTNKQIQKALNLAFSTWEGEIDIKIHPVIPGQKANFTLYFKSSLEEQMFKEKPSVLAYAYFPAQGSVSGKVVFNDDYIWSLDGKEIKTKDAIANGYPVKGTPLPDQLLRTYNVISVLIHELGHSLGLKHDEHNDSDDAMDAYYDGKIDLSDWDIFRIRLKYPERQISKTKYQAFKNAILRAIRSVK